MRATDYGLAGATRWAIRFADALTAPRLSILIFHRVLPVYDPLFPDEIDALRFDRLMAVVARAFMVLTLGQALGLRASGRLPARALVITFDDGYADNAEIALPILLRHGLRATFFIATGFLDGGRMFNDSVIECIRHAGGPHIDLHEFGLGLRSVESAAERRQVIDALLPKVKYSSLDEREAFVARLARLAGSPDLRRDLMMRSKQVVELHRAGMEIGAHTVRHPILRLTPDTEADAEIANGRAHLQGLLDAPVDVFAYPNGRPMQDYDGRHVAMLRRLGFRGGVSTARGVACSESDDMQLPRFTPWDRGMAKWLGRLAHARVSRPKYEVATARP